MTASILEMTEGTAPSTPSAGVADVFVNATHQLGLANSVGNTLLSPVIRENETIAVVSQQNSGNSASPVGNISTAEKMMGLGLVAGFTITPQTTGRIMIIVAGMALNATAAGDGTNVTGKWGTGTAPSNGAAVSGTTFGATQHFIASTTAGQQGFTCMGIVTGLTLGVTVWIDLSVLAVTAGGSTVKDVQIVVEEM